MRKFDLRISAESRERLLVSLENGLPVKSACSLARISYAGFCATMRLANLVQEEIDAKLERVGVEDVSSSGEVLRNGDYFVPSNPFIISALELKADVEYAVAKCEEYHINRVRTSYGRNSAWLASSWWLEKRSRKDFGKVSVSANLTQHNHYGIEQQNEQRDNEITVKVIKSDSQDQLDRLAEIERKLTKDLDL